MLALLLALVVAVPPGEQVIAKVGRVDIRRAEVARRLALSSAPGRAAKPEAALEGLITETVLAEEGRRLGLAGSPEVAQTIQLETRRAAGQALAAELVAKAEVTEPLLRELFHSNSDLLTFDTLVFATREEAAAALQRVARGGQLEAEAPRAVVAKIFAPREAKPVSRAQVEAALAALLLAASPGQLVGPVEAQNGWVVARLLAKEIGSDAAFAERRAGLLRFGRAQLGEQARRHLVAQRKAKVGVTIDEPFLEATKGTEASPAQLEHPVAQVGGAPIRYRQLLASLQRLGAAGGHGGGSLAIKRQLLGALVDERLLEDLAMERGLERFPELEARRGDIARAALAQAAAQRILDTAPAPGEAEIEAFYKENAAAYGRPFEEVLPDVAARAADKKRVATFQARLKALRQSASVSIDRSALASVAATEAR
jgi:hypothetical protein